MMNTIIFKTEFSSQPNVCFGQGFKATFVNNKLEEGNDFNTNDFDFVDKFGASWQKGHLLGVRFGGKNNVENFLPMTQRANIYFKSMVEDKLALLLKNKPVIDANLANETSKLETFRIVYKILVSPRLIEIEGIKIPHDFLASITIEDSIGKTIGDDILNEVCNFLGVSFPIHYVIRTNMA